MTAEKLRVGIIGIGWFAIVSHVPNFRNTGRAEIVAIARRNPDLLERAKAAVNIDRAYRDWREMLDKENLDAVVVNTPHNAHVEPTLAALERGLHVLLEKPMTLTSADARTLIDAAERAHKVLMIGYNGRGMASWRTIKQLVQAETLGRLRQINVACCADAGMFWNPDRLSREIQDLMASSDPAAPFFQDILSRGNWRSDPVQMGGGMLVDSGSHIMDILLWLGDSAASEVIAFTETTDGIVDGMVNCQGRLTNEIMFSITFNNIVSGGETGFYSHGRLTAFGDKGVLTADWNRIMVTEASEVWTEIEGVRNKVDISLPLITPAAGFVATILDQAPNMAPAHEAARVVALAEALGRSAAERRVVQIQPATG